MFNYNDLYGIGSNTTTETNPEPAEVEAYAQQAAASPAVTKKDKINVFGAIILLICAAVFFHSI